jgi:hypothetical protein
MPAITIMAWNIENFGDTKYQKANGRAELIELICEVIAHERVSVVGFSEMRGDRGAKIGQKMAENLNARVAPLAPWRSQTSPQFMKNRWEQYLFVWDTREVVLYNAPNSFQHAFASAAPPPANVGFPRQVASDRPPYLGYFQTVAAPTIQVPIAVFHAPEPGFWLNVRDGCMALARVTEFQNAGDTCVVMGDFNVKSNSNPAVAGSKGAAAFAALDGVGFRQLIPGNNTDDVLTSLIKASGGQPGMTEGDCYSQPYDNLFLRAPNPNPRAIQGVDFGLDELIEDCVAGGYLEPSLRALQQRRTGAAPATYPTVYDAFEPFRRYVSDHMPVVTQLAWT